MDKSETKKMIDYKGDDWKCKTCGCPAKHTQLKRIGRDGEKSICNACYIRERTKVERVECQKQKEVIDSEDDDWKCKTCGCPAKYTQFKRIGRDGEKRKNTRKSRKSRKSGMVVQKQKEVIDYEDVDWKCNICGCSAKHTPLKRIGRDGEKNICNACYIRERTQQERI